MPNTIFISINQVKQKTSLSTPTIYRLMSCNQFPKSINIFGRRVAWIDSEVKEWAKTRIVQYRSNNAINRPLETLTSNELLQSEEADFPTTEDLNND